TGMPRIEMGTEHHDFIFLVGAGNFSHRVVLHRVVIEELVHYIQLQRYLFVLLKQSRYSIPLFNRHGQGWNCGGFTLLEWTSRLHEDGATARRTTAMIDHSQNLLISEELVQVLLKLKSLQIFRKSELTFLTRYLVLGYFGELFFAEALIGSIADRLYFGVGTENQNQSGEFATIFVEILFVINLYTDAFTLDRAVGSRCPSLGVCDEWGHIRRQHSQIDIFLGPTSTKRPPWLKMRIREAERR